MESDGGLVGSVRLAGGVSFPGSDSAVFEVTPAWIGSSRC